VQSFIRKLYIYIYIYIHRAFKNDGSKIRGVIGDAKISGKRTKVLNSI